MRDRRVLIRSLRGIYQQATGPWKSRLDRRYLTRAESTVMLSTLHDSLSSLRSESLDHRVIVDGADQRLAQSEIALTSLSERLVVLETELRDRLAVLDTDISQLRIRTVENRTEAAKGAAFVAHEDPHGLRKKLFESNRLAREGAEAIESLLQAELLLWQKIDAVNAASSESESTNG